MDGVAMFQQQQAATAGYAGAPPPAPYPSQFSAVPYGVEITNRVFIGGCPYNMTELELSQFFSQFGDVKDAKIITDRDGGKSKGYGFVTFATEEQAYNVYSQGSIYYQQKKLNVSKAIRKYGGQYQKANQEYVNGQRLVWLHPNGYLMTQQDHGWHMEPLPSHSQPTKPCYPLYSPPQTSPPSSPGYLYNFSSPFMQPAAVPNPGYAPMYGASYGYAGGSYPTTPTTPTYLEEQNISVISTTAPSSGHASLESSDSSHVSPPLPTEEDEGEGLGEGLEKKTFPTTKNKHLSLDSAYTSEVDLDSHNTTANNSGTASPRVSGDVDKKSHACNATPPSEDSPIVQKLKKLSLGDNNSQSPSQEDETTPPTSST